MAIKYKKITAIAAVTVLLLTGCMSKDVGNSGSPTMENSVEKKYKAAIDSYLKEIPAKQPKTSESADSQKKIVDNMVQLYNQKGSSREIKLLYDNGIDKLSADQADKFTFYAVAALVGNSNNDYIYVEKYNTDTEFIEKFTKEAKSVNNKYSKLNNVVEKIQEPEIKDVVLSAKSQGYYVAWSEGMFYYKVDFTEFAKYRLYFSKPMASLIETMAFESMDPLASDAAFVVSLDTLAARTYEIEKLLNNYKGTKYEKYLAIKYKDYMTMLFFGVNNTPNFNYNTGKINDNALAMFKEIQTIDGMFTSELVKKFNSAVDANGGKLDNSVREKAGDILKEIDTKYGFTESDIGEYRQWQMGDIK